MTLQMAACHTAAAIDDSAPVVLTVGIAGPPSGIQLLALELTTEDLTSTRSDGRYEPHLAESWTIDAGTVTVRLRPGVTFHDGAAFTRRYRHAARRRGQT